MLVTIFVVFMAFFTVIVMVAAVAGISALFGCRFRRVFLRGLWALLLPFVVMVYGMIEIGRYEVTGVDITSENVPASFDRYRIVQISDLHLYSFRGRHKSLKKAVEKINALNPDVVLFTGDLVTEHPSEMDGFEDILSGVKARDGVYSVLGNHDYCIYHRWESDELRQEAVDDIVRRQNAMGWRMLMNENASIARPVLCPGSGPDGNSDYASECKTVYDTLSIIGVENISETSYFPSYGDLDKAMQGADGSFRILMTHDPTHWRKAIVEYPDIDLTLSGHTHAMQLSFFGWSPSSLLFSEYRGLYRRDAAGEIVPCHETDVAQECITETDGTAVKDNFLYVNIGMGETALPARIGTRPEITLITLHSARLSE